MDYIVKRGNNIIATFDMFLDAWLYAFLSDCYCEIIAPDGQRWIVNPPKTN